MQPALIHCNIQTMERELGSTKRSSNDSPLVALRGICKRFGPVLANDEIDFNIFRGEIHALLGENGAGKSTLMKILYGVYRPDAGEILSGEDVFNIHNPGQARDLGIGMVFQDLNLIPAFTVAENIALFLSDLKFVLNHSEIYARIQEMSGSFGLHVDPGALVAELSIGEQQKVELLKLLMSDAKILILDEPTRVLASHEITALFEVLRSLCNAGYAIVLITHRMKDVLACSDRISVLRQGRNVKTLMRESASESVLVDLMFERDLTEILNEKSGSMQSDVLLELTEVDTIAEGSGTGLQNISFKIRHSEIVGVAGISGNGQRELCDFVLGAQTCTRGTKQFAGEDCTNISVSKMRNSGVRFIPENPLTMASAPFMTVLENMALTNTHKYSRHGGLSFDWSAVWDDLNRSTELLGFSVAAEVPARALSGGNLQRMIILRELAHNPLLIIASYITRGLDLQTAVAARKALLRARQDGAGILLISEDLDELFELSDRLLVLSSGKIVGDFKPTEVDVHQVGHLMTGAGETYAG